jgi:hypothetical protein
LECCRMIVQHSSTFALRSYFLDDSEHGRLVKATVLSHEFEAFEILEGVYCSDRRPHSNTGCQYPEK